MTESISASTDQVTQQTDRLADQTGRQLARVGGSRSWLIAFGVITLLVGILVLTWPGKTVLALAVLLGIWLLIAGVFRLITAVAIPERQGSNRAIMALLGVVAILAGVLSLARPLQTVTALALLLGAFWIVSGVIEFFHGVTGDVSGRGWAIAGGLLSVIAGIVVLAYPGASLLVLAWLFGIWLIVLGAVAIAGGFTTGRRSAKAAQHRIPAQAAGPVTPRPQ
jgi:uncharacterized membrane protein HdeD (DUF308 family)